MQPNLKTAILEFLGNEFKLEPSNVSPDMNFQEDLNLTPEETLGLLSRLQESLDFTLPEDSVSTISTVEDLLTALDPESDSPTTP